MSKKKLIHKKILSLWKRLGYKFHGWRVINSVKDYLNQYDLYAYDGYILREMRRLREQGEINYKCIDFSRSLYEKL